MPKALQFCSYLGQRMCIGENSFISFYNWLKYLNYTTKRMYSFLLGVCYPSRALSFQIIPSLHYIQQQQEASGRPACTGWSQALQRQECKACQHESIMNAFHQNKKVEWMCISFGLWHNCKCFCINHRGKHQLFPNVCSYRKLIKETK